MVTPDDYLGFCDALLTRAEKLGYADTAETLRAEAQVKATEAVAAAIDRLAEAVEALNTR